MKIHDKKILREIQKEFNQTFPYLKLEFFQHSNHRKTGEQGNEKLNLELTVGELQQIKKDGFISLDGRTTVGDFENNFENNFGLNVQVYRKSYDRWLETWVTDVWTLAEQNNRGRIMSELEDSKID